MWYVGGGNWNDANAWSATEGGAGGVGPPRAGDNAYFSATSSNDNCTLSATAACLLFATRSNETGGTDNYTGTIDFNGQNIGINSNFYPISTCTIDAGEGIITVGGAFYLLTCTWLPRTSTVVMTGSAALLRCDNKTLYSLTINNNVDIFNTAFSWDGTLTVASGKTLTIPTGLTITANSGAVTTLVGTLAATGTGKVAFKDTAAALLGVGGTLSAPVQFDTTNGNCTIPARTYGGPVEPYSNSASARSCILGAGSHVYSSTFYPNANAAGGLTVDGATNNPTVGITGLVDYTGTGGGSESISFGTGTWTLSGGMNLTGGTCTKGTSTIVMNGSAKTLTSAGQALNNLTIEDDTTFADALDIDGILKCIIASKTLTFCSSVDHVIADLNLDGQAVGTRVVLAPLTAATDWRLTCAAAAAPTKISNVSVDYSDATASPAAVDASDGTNEDGGHNTNWTFAGGTLYYKTLTETLAYTDTRIRSVSRSLVESMILTDARVASLSRTLYEALAVTDLESVQLSRTLSDALVVTDTLGRTPGKLLTETLGLTDTLTRDAAITLLQGLTLSDTRTFALARTLLDTLTITDTLTAEQVWLTFLIARLVATTTAVQLKDTSLEARLVDTSTAVTLEETEQA